jgi:hypothetical protein
VNVEPPLTVIDRVEPLIVALVTVVLTKVREDYC